jgi:N6-L-threonylcarbamoyladenine synthase
LVRRTLQEAQLELSQIDRIAYTRGPGLVGALLVGATFAQGLAKSLGIPCHGLHHLEGHLGAAYLADPRLKPPFVVLVASGGHTELLLALPGFRYRMLGRTRDDAAGEAFDKSGKLLGLGYPAGPILSQEAKSGNRLKSAVARLIHSIPADDLVAKRPDLCASVEEAIVDVLVARTLDAVRQNGVEQVAVVGGVAANRRLRERLIEMGEREGFLSVFPKPSLCGDNGVMMAAIGLQRARAGLWPENQAVLPTMPWDGME